MHGVHSDASSPVLYVPVKHPTQPPPSPVCVPAKHGTSTDTLPPPSPNWLDTLHDTLSVDPLSSGTNVYVNDCVVTVPPWGSVHDTVTVPLP